MSSPGCESWYSPEVGLGKGSYVPAQQTPGLGDIARLHLGPFCSSGASETIGVSNGLCGLGNLTGSSEERCDKRNVIPYPSQMCGDISKRGFCFILLRFPSKKSKWNSEGEKGFYC